MSYECSNYVKGNAEEKFFAGDNVRVYKKDCYQFRGKITRITSRGIYLDVGNKADKYFRAGELDEIAIEEE